MPFTPSVRPTTCVMFTRTGHFQPEPKTTHVSPSKGKTNKKRTIGYICSFVSTKHSIKYGLHQEQRQCHDIIKKREHTPRPSPVTILLEPFAVMPSGPRFVQAHTSGNDDLLLSLAALVQPSRRPPEALNGRSLST
jgi:hypothetical protein